LDILYESIPTSSLSVIFNRSQFTLIKITKKILILIFQQKKIIDFKYIIDFIQN